MPSEKGVAKGTQVDPLPEEVTYDEDGDPILWYWSGTRVTFTMPRYDTSNTQLRTIRRHKTIINDDSFWPGFFNEEVDNELRNKSFTITIPTRHIMVYNVWQCDMPTYDFLGRKKEDQTDDKYYSFVDFNYDKEKVHFTVMPATSYHTESKTSGTVVKYLARPEPLFFKVEGINGHYVTDVKVALMRGDAQVYGPVTFDEWVSFTRQTPAGTYNWAFSEKLRDTDKGAYYEYGVINTEGWNNRAVISVETKPFLKLSTTARDDDEGLDYSVTSQNGQYVKNLIVNYDKDINQLKPGDRVTMTLRYKKGYFLDYGQRTSGYGLYNDETGQQLTIPESDVSITTDPNNERYNIASITMTMGETNQTMRIAAWENTSEMFTVSTQSVFADSIDSYVENVNRLGSIKAEESKGVVGLNYGLTISHPDYIVLQKVVSEYTNSNGQKVEEDVTAQYRSSQTFPMPQANTTLKAYFALNRAAGYRKADITTESTYDKNMAVFNTTFSTPDMYSGKMYYNIADNATKRIVKVGETVKVDILLADEYNYGYLLYASNREGHLALCQQGNTFVVPEIPFPDVDPDIKCMARIAWGWQIGRNVIGDPANPDASVGISRWAALASTPITVNQQIADNLEGLGTDFDLVYSWYKRPNQTQWKDAELMKWDMPDGYRFTMPSQHVLVYITKQHYINATVNIIGAGCKAWLSGSLGIKPLGATSKLRPGDEMEIITEVPSEAWRVKRVWLEWSDVPADALLEAVTLPTELDGLSFTVPTHKFKPTLENTYGTNLTVTVNVEFEQHTLVFSDADDAYDNNDVWHNNLDGQPHTIVFKDRTFYRDGRWNTLMLPFDVNDFSGTPLEGAEVRTLTDESASYNNGTLTLNFTEPLTAIEGCKAYFVRWPAGQDNITDPTFKNVILKDEGYKIITLLDYGIQFFGMEVPYQIPGEDHNVLYLGGDNKLYYPNGPMTIKPFRAYFALLDYEAVDTPMPSKQNISEFVLNFGDGVTSIDKLAIDNAEDAWYSIDGRKLNGEPTAKGIYIHNGKKLIVK